MDKKKTASPAEVHREHRARMRERFENAAPASFADHELLEMLLYYAIPRVNTNTQAHALLKTFGSLPRVLEADEVALRQVPGIGGATAQYLHLVFTVFCRALQRRNEEDTPAPSEIGQIGKYLVNYFTGKTKETMVLLTFDSRRRLNGTFVCAEGTANDVSFAAAPLLRYAIMQNADAVVCAHNHPDGMAIPSPADFYLTSQLRYAFAAVNIHLEGNYIVAGKHFQKIDENNGY